MSGNPGGPQPLGRLPEGPGPRAVGVADHHGFACVARLADPRVQGDPGQEGYSEPLRQGSPPTFSAIRAARAATSTAACCGVVTTSTSARGSCCATVMDTSPVPGGRSRRRVSMSPQCTSVMKVRRALCSMGPRQMTASSRSTSMPMDTARTPHLSRGMIIWSMTVGRPSIPSIRGMEKPYTSASRTPTRLPPWARATARLAVTVDLPTPPFPLATARTRTPLVGDRKGEAAPPSWPRSLAMRAWRSSGPITPKCTSTARTPGRRATRSRMDCTITSRRGQPPMVSTASTRTCPSWTRTSRTMSRSTMDRRSSGSSTSRRASRTCSRVSSGSFLPKRIPLPPLSTTGFPPMLPPSEPPKTVARFLGGWHQARRRASSPSWPRSSKERSQPSRSRKVDSNTSAANSSRAGCARKFRATRKVSSSPSLW